MAFGDGVGHWPTAVATMWWVVMLHLGFHLLKISQKNSHLNATDDGQTILWPASLDMKEVPNAGLFRWGGTLAFLATLPASLQLMFRGGQWVIGGIIGLYMLLLLTMILHNKFRNRRFRDLLILCLYGPLPLTLTYYTQSLEMNAAVILAGMAPGLFAVGFMTIMERNELLRKQGKETWLHSEFSPLPQPLPTNETSKGGEDFPSLFGAGSPQNVLDIAAFNSRLRSIFNNILSDYLLSILLIPFIPILIFFTTHDHPFTLAAGIIAVLAAPGIKLFYDFSDEKSQLALTHWNLKLVFVYSLLFSIGWCLS